jgi:hypothetical protein
MPFYSDTLSWFLVFRRVYVALSFVFCVMFCRPLVVLSYFLSFDHCVVCSSIYGLWLSVCYLQTFFTNCETNPAERSTNSCRRPEAFRIEDSILALITPYISSLFVNKSYSLSADLVLLIALEYWWRHYFGYWGVSLENFLHFALFFFYNIC